MRHLLLTARRKIGVLDERAPEARRHLTRGPRLLGRMEADNAPRRKEVQLDAYAQRSGPGRRDA